MPRVSASSAHRVRRARSLATAVSTKQLGAFARAQLQNVAQRSWASDQALMSPQTCETCDVFRNADITISPDSCATGLQNEYEAMCNGLKPRSNVPAPSDAFTCVDEAPPMVRILEPATGSDVLQVFNVSVEASDECGVYRVSLLDQGEPISVDLTPPYVLGANLPVGDRTLTVVAEDNYGTQATAELSIVVHPGECPRLC